MGTNSTARPSAAAPAGTDEDPLVDAFASLPHAERELLWRLAVLEDDIVEVAGSLDLRPHTVRNSARQAARTLRTAHRRQGRLRRAEADGADRAMTLAH